MSQYTNITIKAEDKQRYNDFCEEQGFLRYAGVSKLLDLWEKTKSRNEET